MSNILIASTSLDYSTYGPVMAKLDARGHDVVVYEADKVAHGDASLEINIDSSGKTQILYDEDVLETDAIQASWYRHPDLLGYKSEDKAKQLCLEKEVQDLQQTIWQSIPEQVWLNSPENIRKAQVKLAQLSIAGALGFEVPKTVIANHWNSIEEEFVDKDSIVKMSKGLLYDNDEIKGLYTTVLTPEKLHHLTETTFPFPAIFQESIPKEKEWRVTVVGEKVFEAAIYTTSDAKDDWRKHQLTDKVTFVKESLPDDITERCVNFLSKFGLLYGAFDLIEGQDSRITFLECNPNGHFMWLEQSLDLPISDAIAGELIKIAKTS